jgi:hypothetical protein
MDNLIERLERATQIDDPYADFGEICEDLRKEQAGPEILEILLQFIEGHPDVDYGSPGPLMHYMETFSGLVYEGAVLASLARRPTSYTIWMLNRMINSAKGDDRLRLVEAMKACATHPLSGPQEQDNVSDFLEFQESPAIDASSAEPAPPRAKPAVKTKAKAAPKAKGAKPAAKSKAAKPAKAKAAAKRKAAKPATKSAKGKAAKRQGAKTAKKTATKKPAAKAGKPAKKTAAKKAPAKKKRPK